MSHPRISVFAGSANGNVNPIRTLDGQNTLMARTTHELAVDTKRDQIVVPNPFAQALLFFRDVAEGDEKPLRVIQGPKTLLGGSMDTDNVSIDVVNDELYVTQEGSDSIFVYPAGANGDVAPVRVLHGPKTDMRFPRRVTVDPINNLMAVVASKGILIFNRTDEGDVAPRCVITGPKTGLGGGEGFTLSKAQLYPAAKKIIFGGGAQRVPKGHPGRQRAFTAVWNYGDCGDVAPTHRLEEGSGIFDINQKAKEIIMIQPARDSHLSPAGSILIVVTEPRPCGSGSSKAKAAIDHPDFRRIGFGCFLTSEVVQPPLPLGRGSVKPPLKKCHSERREESALGRDWVCHPAKSRFLAALGMTMRGYTIPKNGLLEMVRDSGSWRGWFRTS